MRGIIDKKGGDFTPKSHYSYIRTNFFMDDEGYEGCQIYYRYEPGFSPQFIAYRAILFAYLNLYKNMLDEVHTCIEELLLLINLRDMKHAKSTDAYSLLWECLSWFIENGYFYIHCRGKVIKTEEDFRALTLSQHIVFKIYEEEFFLVAIADDNGGFKANEPFVLLTFEEFSALTNDGAKNVLETFLAYLFIKKYIGWRNKERYSPSERPACALITGEILADDLRCSPRTANRHLDYITNTARLLNRKELARSDKTKNPAYIYVLNQPGWEDELKYGAAKYHAERRNST